MKENMKSRRGVALAEAVIALVVIGIISVATLTIIFSSVQIENKTIVAMDVRNQAENAIECFRFAKGDKDVFFACMEKIAKSEEANFIKTAEAPFIWVLDKGGYEITIKATVENETMTGFSFKATYKNEDMDPIYEYNFPKIEGGVA